ncbi:MAG: hypothetical protein AB8B82_09985 [Roseovarius sp.]
MRTVLYLMLPLILVAAFMFFRHFLEPRTPDREAMRLAYAQPLAKPDAPLNIFHLGHSLVGRDMPAMLAQLAGDGHRYDSQLGWGTSLKQHWQGRDAINGFDVENDHPRYRDARDAISSGDYDAVVLTEMVEIRDATKYHQSGKHLTRWADLARSARPDAKVYLYESWHKLDDPEGWLDRLDSDLSRYWEDAVIGPDLTGNGQTNPVRIIPAGQVMAAFVRTVEAQGGVGNIAAREDLFARDAGGQIDPIHVNDKGAYLVALTHYATLYHRSPEGLPHELVRADGTVADAPSPDAAAVMQRIVWEVVTGYDKTGVVQ